VDLTARLVPWATARPHVLVVPAVGATAQRLAVEAELTRRGWPAALSPADADLLVVAGTPGPRLGPVLDAVWRQVPQPRARTIVPRADAAADVLDDAVAQLSGRPPAIPRNPDEPPMSEDDNAHASHRGAHHTEHSADGPDAPHAGQPNASAGAHHGAEPTGPPDGHGGGHGSSHGSGHGEHMLGMELPGGLAMASLAEDRDGLALDQLHVPLGPVLPDWPAGLVLRVALQGDVVQQSEAEVLDGAVHRESYWTQPSRRAAFGERVPRGEAARWIAAAELDALGRLLAVLGWDEQAVRARLLRDALLAGAASEQVAGPVSALLRRVGRSRVLRWSLRGIGAGLFNVPARLAYRLEAIAEAVDQLDDATPLDGDWPARRIAADELPRVLVGVELAAVRIIVAALDPDTDAMTAPTHDGGRDG
jgi:hypothetical protein